MKNSLEKHRTFPIIAWGTFIGFAIFVFYLTTQLQETATELSSKTTRNVEALKSIESIEDVVN